MKGFLGIDVSKGYADFAILSEDFKLVGDILQFDDTRKGHEQLSKWIKASIKKHGFSEVICAVESTGGFEDNWHALLVDLSSNLPLKVARLNPSVVKDAAKATLTSNVTDGISAINIASYLIRYEDKVDFRVRSNQYTAYRSLHKHITLLKKQKAQLINQLKQLLYVTHPELQRFCKHSVPKWVLELLMQYPNPAKLARAQSATVAKIKGVTLAKAQKLIEKARESVGSRGNNTDGILIQGMAADIAHNEGRLIELKDYLGKVCKGPEVELLKTVKGIGAYSAAVIMIEIEDIERFSTPAQLSSYFGLHPKIKQSGDKKSVSRMSKQGRPAMRSALFMCANSAVLCDKHMKDIYKKHREAGKTHTSAIGVIMHKMLRVVWGILNSKKTYDSTVDQHNQAAVRKSSEQTETLEIQAKRRLQPFDEDAPISRIAAKKRKVHVASQSDDVGTERDLEHAPAV